MFYIFLKKGAVMRLGKFFALLLMALPVLAIVACSNTVSSTDASDNGGLDAVPGYHPGKSYNGPTSSEKTPSGGSSSSATASSASEVSSSSSMIEVDFSESKIQVDERGFAVITEEYLVDVTASVASELEDLKAQLEDNAEPEGFDEVGQLALGVDDLQLDKYLYYCYTESEDWFQITKDKLLETKLPFLWGGAAYEARGNFTLDFAEVCISIYSKLE
jgi:hypothetical protein